MENLIYIIIDFKTFMQKNKEVCCDIDQPAAKCQAIKFTQFNKPSYFYLESGPL